MTRNRFKAGDVVKPSGRVYDLRVGGEYTVESQAAPTDMAWIMLRGHHNPSTTDGSYPEDRFEPARCAQPAGVQIEEGKFYRTAAGDKVGPMVAWRVDRGLFHVQSGPCVGGLWKPDGTAEYPGAGDSPTLIAECREAQPGDRIRMLRNDGAGGYKAGDHFVTVNGETFIDNDGDSRPLDGHPHKVVGAAEKPLRVGDRVRAIRGRPGGHTGTIIEDVGDGMPLVKFDDWHGGHDGNGECGDSGYWCHEGDFERIEESGFKKGDRVRALDSRPEGETGTVVAVNYDSKQVLVAFDNWRDGHNGRGAGLDLNGSGWWLRPAGLERIEEPASGAPADDAPKFKVGDRVRRSGGLFPEEIGTVARVFGSGDFYRVEWDNGEGTSDTWTARELVTAPVFKVGDRVRFTDKCPRTWWFGPHTKHKEGVITADDGGGVYDVEVPGTSTPAFITAPDQIEPAPSPAPHAIVALIKSGKPKPSPTPRVHPDRTAAAMEAERLARVYPGKEFGVYELAETRSRPAPKHEWQRLAAAGRRNDAVSELMRVAGVAAPSAFSAVDRFRNAA